MLFKHKISIAVKKVKFNLANNANIYGTPDVETIDESIAPKPINFYAISKVSMTLMART